MQHQSAQSTTPPAALRHLSAVALQVGKPVSYACAAAAEALIMASASATADHHSAFLGGRESSVTPPLASIVAAATPTSASIVLHPNNSRTANGGGAAGGVRSPPARDGGTNQHHALLLNPSASTPENRVRSYSGTLPRGSGGRSGSSPSNAATAALQQTSPALSSHTLPANRGLPLSPPAALEQRPPPPTGCRYVDAFTIPTLPELTIAAYYHRLEHALKLDAVPLVASIVLLGRATTSGHTHTDGTACKADVKEFAVTPYNVHRLVLASVVVASKIQGDFFLPMAAYAAAGGVSVKTLLDLELVFFSLLQYNAWISVKDFIHGCTFCSEAVEAQQNRALRRMPLVASVRSKAVDARRTNRRIPISNAAIGGYPPQQLVDGGDGQLEDGDEEGGGGDSVRWGGGASPLKGAPPIPISSHHGQHARHAQPRPPSGDVVRNSATSSALAENRNGNGSNAPTTTTAGHNNSRGNATTTTGEEWAARRRQAVPAPPPSLSPTTTVPSATTMGPQQTTAAMANRSLTVTLAMKDDDRHGPQRFAPSLNGPSAEKPRQLASAQRGGAPRTTMEGSLATTKTMPTAAPSQSTTSPPGSPGIGSHPHPTNTDRGDELLTTQPPSRGTSPSVSLLSPPLQQQSLTASGNIAN